MPRRVGVLSRCGYDTPLGPCSRRSLGYCPRHRAALAVARLAEAALELSPAMDIVDEVDRFLADNVRWARLRDRRRVDMLESRRRRGKLG